jgi:hypothetical protein
VAVDEALSVGTIEGAAASIMTVLVEVEVRPFWSVAAWAVSSWTTPSTQQRPIPFLDPDFPGW